MPWSSGHWRQHSGDSCEPMPAAAAPPDPAQATPEKVLAEFRAALAESKEALAKAAGNRRSPAAAWLVQAERVGRRSGKRISGLRRPRASLFEAAGIDSGEGPMEDASATAPLSRPRRPFNTRVLQPAPSPPKTALAAVSRSDNGRAGFAPARNRRLSTAH